VHIALIHELSSIVNPMSIDTEAVLEAAGTKGNFLPFRPGLVGGHCIGVDPYYLTHKAQSIGYHPEVILAGRRVNDNMGVYVASQLVKALTRRGIAMSNVRVLVLGFAFKENCPDLRNTRVVDIVSELRQYEMNVDVYDPWVSREEANHEYGLSLIDKPAFTAYDAIVLAVAHKEFAQMGIESMRAFGKPNHVLYDLKYVFPAESSDIRL
jgi:UDP-N-acetyl-D-galactosamine dehydrogenase